MLLSIFWPLFLAPIKTTAINQFGKKKAKWNNMYYRIVLIVIWQTESCRNCPVQERKKRAEIEKEIPSTALHKNKHVCQFEMSLQKKNMYWSIHTYTVYII